MAKKPTLTTVSSGFQSNAVLNTNLEALRDGFDNTLSLDGSTPNAMNADLDMNSNSITNADGLSISGDFTYKGTILVDPTILVGVTVQQYSTVILLLASVETTRGVGAIWEAEGHRYIEVASSGDITTAGSIDLDVLPAQDGTYPLDAWGIIGNGVTDDQAIVELWCAYLATNSVEGTLPAKDIVLASAVSVTVTSATRFSIRGQGAASRFLTTAGGLNFDATAAGRTNEVHFADFQIVTTGTTGTGLSFDQLEGGTQHQRTIVLDNVQCRGSDKTNDYFATFFSFAGAWRPLLTNFTVDGPHVGVDLTDGSNKYAALTGVNLIGAYDPTLSDFHIWGCTTGISSKVYSGTISGVADQGGGVVRVTVSNGPHPFTTGFSVVIAGTSSYNGTFTVTNVSSTEFDITDTFVATETGTAALSTGPEAFRMTNYVINGVRVGLDYERPQGREPIIWADSGHMNYRDDGFKIDGCKLFISQAHQMYNEDTTDEYSGTPHDFNLVNVSDWNISNGYFHFDGHSSRIACFVTTTASGAGDNGFFVNNHLSGTFDYGVWLASAATGVTVGPNKYTGTITTANVNDVSTSNILIDDARTNTAGTWTPVLSFGGGVTGITYSTQTGTYDIVSGWLHYAISVTLTSKGSDTGNASVTLPTALSGPLTISSASISHNDMSFYTALSSVVAPTARVVGATELRLIDKGSANVANLADTNLTDTSVFQLSGSIKLV